MQVSCHHDIYSKNKEILLEGDFIYGKEWWDLLNLGAGVHLPHPCRQAVLHTQDLHVPFGHCSVAYGG
jgi:hypothetical protein